MSKQIEHVHFVSTLSKRRNSLRHCCSGTKNGNNVEATFGFVERIVRLVAFDNVASTLLLVWTGLNGKSNRDFYIACPMLNHLRQHATPVFCSYTLHDKVTVLCMSAGIRCTASSEAWLAK